MDDRCSIQQHGCILRLEYIHTRHPHGKDLVCVYLYANVPPVSAELGGAK